MKRVRVVVEFKFKNDDDVLLVVGNLVEVADEVKANVVEKRIEYQEETK